MGNSNAMKHGPYKENVFLSQITLNTFGANNNEHFLLNRVQTVSFMGQISISNKLCFSGPFVTVKMIFPMLLAILNEDLAGVFAKEKIYS